MSRHIFFPVLLSLSLIGCQDKDGDGSGTVDSASTGGDGVGTTDADGDGYDSDEDCDDNDASVNEGSAEVCDGVDNNCDGEVDEGVTNTYYRDADGDGFGDETTTTEACESPDGYVPNGNDCDDGDTDAYPGNSESCDGIDNDCDDEVDEDVTTTYYADSDGDGYGDPDSVDEACSQPAGYVTDDTDCDDSSADSFPDNLEVCDELDNDCDGEVDEGVTTTYYADTDGDSYGDPSLTQEACARPTGYSATAGDCDDSESTTNPGAMEYCDGHDDDCDGDIDEDDAVDVATWYADADGDTYGDASVTDYDCNEPAGYVSDDTDCDDTEATTYPGADEYCDGHDDDCDGETDEDDSVDVSTWYADDDEDGYGDADTSDIDCYEPTGYVSDDTDCDDTYSMTYPGADEYCDEKDNDCDGDIDEDGEVVDGDTFYLDADSDDLGDPDETIQACDEPAGYSDEPYDCNDADATEPKVVDAVSGSASGSGTLGSPFDSMQDGIDAAEECVVVYAGTYEEALDLSGISLDIWGVEGASYTTIDADKTPCDASSPDGCEPAVTIAGGVGAEVTLRGFTITGGSGYTTSSSSSQTCADSSSSHGGDNTCTVNVYNYCGGGIYVDGDDPTLEDLIIRGNELPEFEQVSIGSFEQNWVYSFGGGLCVESGSAVTMDSVKVQSNYADEGGGIWAAGTIDYEQSRIQGNEASDGAGVYVDGGSFSATNAVVAFNDASTDGGGMFVDSGSTTVTNVSGAYNTSSTTGSSRGDALYIASSGSAGLYNSILTTNSANYVVYNAGSLTNSYNDVYNSSAGGDFSGGSAGTGGISASPSFTSVTDDGNYNNDNWSLYTGSVCIDAGDPSTGAYDADGTRNDMGAYGGPGGDW